MRSYIVLFIPLDDIDKSAVAIQPTAAPEYKPTPKLLKLTELPLPKVMVKKKTNLEYQPEKPAINASPSKKRTSRDGVPIYVPAPTVQLPAAVTLNEDSQQSEPLNLDDCTDELDELSGIIDEDDGLEVNPVCSENKDEKGDSSCYKVESKSSPTEKSAKSKRRDSTSSSQSQSRHKSHKSASSSSSSRNKDEEKRKERERPKDKDEKKEHKSSSSSSSRHKSSSSHKSRDKDKERDKDRERDKDKDKEKDKDREKDKDKGRERDTKHKSSSSDRKHHSSSSSSSSSKNKSSSSSKSFSSSDKRSASKSTKDDISDLDKIDVDSTNLFATTEEDIMKECEMIYDQLEQEFASLHQNNGSAEDEKSKEETKRATNKRKPVEEDELADSPNKKRVAYENADKAKYNVPAVVKRPDHRRNAMQVRN